MKYYKKINFLLTLNKLQMARISVNVIKKDNKRGIGCMNPSTNLVKIAGEEEDIPIEEFEERGEVIMCDLYNNGNKLSITDNYKNLKKK